MPLSVVVAVRSLRSRAIRRQAPSEQIGATQRGNSHGLVIGRNEGEVKPRSVPTTARGQGDLLRRGGWHGERDETAVLLLRCVLRGRVLARLRSGRRADGELFD